MGLVRFEGENNMPDVKKAHAKLCDEHQEAAERYVVNRTTAYVAFQHLIEVYEEAKNAIIESGALEVDQDGKIKAGWYKSDAGYEDHRVETTNNSGVAAGGSAAGIAGATPRSARCRLDVGGSIWHCIHRGRDRRTIRRSGNKCDSPAWFGGGAVAAGGLGIAAAPFVLSGIGIVAGVGILGAAGLIGRNQNKRNEKNMQDADKTMKEAMLRMEVNAAKLKSLADEAKPISNNLVRATGVLLTNKDQEAASYVDQALTKADHLFPKLQEPLPYTRLYVGRPSPIESLTFVVADRNNVTMRWKDPDDGNSETVGYKIFYTTGFMGEAKFLMNIEKPEFTHTELKPGTKYEYKIVPFNLMGEADVQRTFKARTQSA